jgi:GntR family transcriptional repressor for pyruvate dehydrogenase complex
LRGILEVEAAALAALRRQQQDLDSLAAKMGAMSEAPYGGVVWLRMDLDFHTAIATATRNDYISQVLVFVSERVRESILASGHRQGSDVVARLTLDEHHRILDAIVDGDAVAAQAAMRAHLKGAAERVGLFPSAEGALTEAEAFSELPRGWLEGARPRPER